VWEDLASANIKTLRGVKHRKLEEAAVIFTEQWNATSGTATYEVIKGRANKSDSRWVLQTSHTDVDGYNASNCITDYHIL
jgi:hypothetical protein